MTRNFGILTIRYDSENVTEVDNKIRIKFMTWVLFKIFTQNPP